MPSHFFPYKCNRLPRVPSVTFLLVWRSSTQSDTAWANHSTANPRKVTARVLVWSQTCEWAWEVGTRQCRGQEYHWRYGLQKADVHFNKILMFPLEWESWNPQILESSQVRMHRKIVGLWCPHHECLRDQVELNRTHSTNESQLTVPLQNQRNYMIPGLLKPPFRMAGLVSPTSRAMEQTQQTAMVLG